jgi:glycerol-3-phosphate dehydrogenase
MAEETINKAIKEGYLENRKCVTSNLKLSSLNLNSSSDRLHIYGDRSPEIRKIMSDDPGLGNPIDPRLPYTRAEILWICRNEMPLTVEDMLARRTRALFLNAQASSDIATEVAVLMANELGFDIKWQNEQIESYKQLVKNYI